MMPKKVKKEKKAARDDNQASSSSTNRVSYFKSKQKEKKSVPIQNQENSYDECYLKDDSNDWIARNDQIVDGEVTTLKEANDESLEADVQVGAFAVPGIGGGKDCAG